MTEHEVPSHDGTGSVEAMGSDGRDAELERLRSDLAESRREAEKWKRVLAKRANYLVVARGVTWEDALQEAEIDLLERPGVVGL